jgi:hypothetical protein
MLKSAKDREVLIPRIDENPEVAQARRKLVALRTSHKAARDRRDQLVAQRRTQQSAGDASIANAALALLHGKPPTQTLVTDDELRDAERQVAIHATAEADAERLVYQAERKASEAVVKAHGLRELLSAKAATAIDAGQEFHEAIAAHNQFVRTFEAGGYHIGPLNAMVPCHRLDPGNKDEPGTLLHHWISEVKEAGYDL